MKIKYSKKALKYLSRMDKATIKRITDGVEGLTHNPPAGDIKIMEGYHDGRQRLRVGKYRVIYRYDDDDTVTILFVIDIGSRGDIYK